MPTTTETLSQARLDRLAVDTIRLLAVDAVEQAGAGSAGMPMGAAPMAYVLWSRILRHNPANPEWFDRDRFVLSAGHGAMLLYSLLHLTGYDLPAQELQRFRQWASATPAFPERGRTPGVEVSTGPLGQGFAAGVGLAIAEASLGGRYNRRGFDVIDHYTYGIVSDGDLMEGVSAEAASLAAHLKLGKLIYLYDDNRMSMAGSTRLAFTEDCAARFDAYGWHTESVADGDDLGAIERALHTARDEGDRPSLVLVRTHIGRGSPYKQDTFEVHGGPLGSSEVARTKETLGLPAAAHFSLPKEVAEHLRRARRRGEQVEDEWLERLAAYEESYPESGAELRMLIEGRLPQDWDADLPSFTPDEPDMAPRVASEKTLLALAPRLPSLLGGAADVEPAVYATILGAGDFEDPSMATGDMQGSAGGGWSYRGRNIHFGVREHAMGAILGGLAAHGGVIPYGATMLAFSDYMRPPIRLAAMQGLGVVFLFTHDSIALGDDGPMFQPVEQLAGLRAVPGLIVLRPCDANETVCAWRVAIETRDRPVAIVLAAQRLPILDRGSMAAAESLRKGAYSLIDPPQGTPELILIATGSEVAPTIEAADQLQSEGIPVRVVSAPSLELFDIQPEAYREAVLPASVAAKLSIEAGCTRGWRRYVGEHGDSIGVDRFGASAPREILMREYGLTKDHIYQRAKAMLKREKG